MMKPKANIPDLKGKTILVAEDEEINFLFIETLIEPTGAEVKHVWNGQQAIDEIKNNKNIDLILMDIKMPIIDGYQATREIKLLNPDIPVVAQTAYALGDDKIHCFDAGCEE
ncbi:MAG: response regulator, partial [Bacteroidota bacterium]